MRKMIAVSILALICSGCDFRDEKTKQSDQDAHDQREFQLKMQQNGLDAQQAEIKLRQQVIKTCVDKGLLPVITGGNIDCKAVK